MIDIAKILISGAFDFFKHRSERKKIERSAELEIKQAQNKAQISRIESGDNAAINMDILSAQNRGWKDDYLLIIMTIPVILSFVPPMVSYVTQGFEALAQIPDWYMWCLFAVFIDTFGFRRILRTAIDQYIAKKFN